MGKITPRFLLIILIYGLFIHAVNPLFSNISYGPEKPVLKEKQQNNLFFVGFLLELAPSITLTENTPATCSDAQDGALNIDVSGGVSPYSYSWSGPNNFSNTTQGISGLAPGNYTVTVTDSNEDTETQSFTVEFEDLEAPTVNLRNIEVQLDSNGSVSIQASDIDNGSSDNCGIDQISISKTNFSCTDVGDNTVSLSVTDINGNTATKDATVTVKDNISPNVITQNITVQLDENGTASITPDQIDNDSTDACGIESTSLDISTFDCTDIGENIVTLSVTDNNDNTATKNATVTVEDNIAPAVITQNITVQLDENGIASITADQIDNGSTDACGIQSTALDISTFNCTDIGENTVTLSVTDIHNNTASNTAIVTVEDKIKPVLPTLNDITWGCEYTVETPVAIDNCGGEIAGTPSRSTTFTKSGIITWTFTDASGNSDSLEQNVTINQIELNVQVDDILCNGFATGEAKVIVTGGVGPITYDWGELGNGTTKDGLSPGNYSVTATDVNGCLATKEFTISEPESFIEINEIIINEGCHNVDDGQLIIEASGGTGELTYLLNNKDITLNGQGIANDLAAGNYELEVIDENNCSTNDSITIKNPEELKITNVVTTETTSFGSETGTATVLVEGGTPGYSFQWSDGQTGQTASNLAADEYSVTVTDANGCSDTAEVIIIDPISVTIVPGSICEEGDDSNDGRRTAYFRIDNGTAIGGYGSYTYQWDFGDPSDIENDPETSGPGRIQVKYSTTGNKTIRLTTIDAIGNEYKTEILYYVGQCQEINCGSSDGSFDVENIYLGDSDGKMITTNNCSEDVDKYLYFKNLSNRSVYSLSIEYTYTVTNGDNGEIREIEEELCLYEYQEIPELVKLAQVDWKCGDNIQLENVLILFAQNKNRACGEGSKPKCYGSNDQGSIDIPLYATATANELLCNGASNGKINVRASGGSSPYSDNPYSYKLISAEDGSTVRSSQLSGVFEELDAGRYEVIVSDNHDPQNTFKLDVLEITQPSNPLTITEINRLPLVCFEGNDAEVNVLVNGGTAPYTIIWSNGQSSTTAESTVSNLPAGEHSVEVIDANGCISDYEFEIEEPEELIANAGNDQVLECGVNQINLGGVFEGYINPRTEEEEFGTWRIINGPTGAVISDPNNPESLFTITTTGTYTLEWTIPCGSSDRVKIIFSNCSTIDFDGVDDYIDFGNNLNLTSGFTLEAWIKQDQNATTSIKTILSKRDNANLAAGGYDIIIENNIPKFRWNNQTISSSHQIDSDRWYHIAVIQGGNDAGIYIDGIKTGESVSDIPSSIDNRFLIGAMHDSTLEPLPTHFFHGWIEEVRVWNTSLELDQLKFMMNQRIKNNTNVRGEVIPLDVPNNLKWENLTGYYRLITSEATNGITKNKIPNGIDGRLKNIQSTQQNTAPLPYIATGGDWWNKNSWKESQVWDAPNSQGVDNATKIDWNIVKLEGNALTNSATSDNSGSITLLGLLDNGGSLNMKGEKNISGNSLTVTHYLELNGQIDLNGESQLLQTEGSQLRGSGSLERDQQGTASSFNYNYWSSPVLPNSNSNTYKVNQVMHDGSEIGTNKFKEINFKWPHTHADGPKSNPIKISDYWINTFRKKKANEYSAWEQIGSYTAIKPGEGYTMKGTENIDISKGKLQNYTFSGFPNNGDISLPGILPDQNYLIGNPYPSAVNAYDFILDHISAGEGNHTQNVFNGSLYYWDHYSGKTHYLAEYIGGYATYNLSGGLRAISTDERINNQTDLKGTKEPGQFIPVGQGFFINTATGDPNAETDNNIQGGTITFKNKYRFFSSEENENNSQFLRPEESQKTKNSNKLSDDGRYKIRLNFYSPTGYNRQILATADAKSTNHFDLGFDAPLLDNAKEDMYWMINNSKFVIQGVPHFNLDQKLPIGLKIAEEKEFSIEIGELENVPDIIDIYLRDNSDSTYHDLRKEAFKASLPVGEYQDLYEIVFHDVTSTRNDKEPGEGPIDYYYSLDNREFVISNPELHKIEHINIYNIAGQLVDQHFGIPDLKEIHVPQKKSLSSAVYIVKVYTDAGDYAKKVIIRKD